MGRAEQLGALKDSVLALPYPDSFAHLADELGWVRQLLAEVIAEHGALRPKRDVLGGIAVDRTEIERFLDGTVVEVDRAPSQAIRDRIERRVARTAVAGTPLALAELAQRFELEAEDHGLFCVLLAPELDADFERVYCYAWDDFTRKRADAGFAAKMMARSFAERARAAARLQPGARLIESGLVEIDPDPTRGFLDRPLRVPARVTRFLVGHDGGVAGDEIRVLVPEADRDDLAMAATELDRIFLAFGAELEASHPARVVLWGPRGGGKKLLVEAVASDLLAGDAIVVAQIRQAAGLERVLREARLEATLRDALIYLDAASIEEADELEQVAQSCARALAAHRGPLVFAATRPVRCFPGALVVRMPPPDAASRALLWTRALPEDRPAVAHELVAEIGRQFPLTAGAIVLAARAAAQSADERAAGGELLRQDLVDGARRQLSSSLTHLARRVTTTLTWSDVVLPPDVLGRLREVSMSAAQARKVYDEWGFGAKVPYGRGLSVLFHGPPGTGKTMVAGIIAADLGMDLFRIDLSSVVSKWVGETEKNLATIFDEAEHGQAILLFDEADALFSKRTDVKSSNDRYANLEVNFLLQRMEEYEGVTILTTNFESGIDEAFKRRLKFRIEFPAPDDEARAALWKAMFPPQAMVDDDIDWPALGQKFEITGGHIKNAVLRAAFRAADRGDRISERDLRQCAAIECGEMGKLVRE